MDAHAHAREQEGGIVFSVITCFGIPRQQIPLPTLLYCATGAEGTSSVASLRFDERRAMEWTTWHRRQHGQIGGSEHVPAARAGR